MGCGDSKASFPAPLSPLALQPKDRQVVAPMTPHLLAAGARKPQRQGTGTDKGKDMGSPNISQIMLDGKFHDKGDQEDPLKSAYMTGHEHAKFHMRGQSYEHLIIITVGLDQPGTMIVVKDPNNSSQHAQLYVPAHAKPGQKMSWAHPRKWRVCRGCPATTESI